MAHTEGEWKVVEDTETKSLHEIWADYGSRMVYVARTCYAPMSEANAKLIAASPELLSALQEICKELEENDLQSDFKYISIYNIAQYAIQKATT